MTGSDIRKKHKQIREYIFTRQLVKAFLAMDELVKLTAQDRFVNDLHYQRENYENILKYALGTKDPEKPDIYDNIRKSLLELADQVRENLLGRYEHTGMYAIYQTYQQNLKKEDIQKRVQQLIYSERDVAFLKDQFGSEEDRTPLMLGLFHLLWFTDKLSEEDVDFWNSLFFNADIHWAEKAVLASALTLSIQRVFDSEKWLLLFSLLELDDSALKQRALVGLILVLNQYDAQMRFYPDLLNRLALLGDKPGMEEQVGKIAVQLIRAKDTERINQKLQEEILPEVEKMKPRLNEKLGLDDLVKAPEGENENPDWQAFFEDTPDLYQKLEEVSKLHMEGADVFMGAFSMLKHFDFFKRTDHWFLPFYENNLPSKQALDEFQNEMDVDDFINNLAQTPFMCNSDKYSFCLNLKMIPGAYKKNTVDLFMSEIEQMKEVGQETSIVDPAEQDRLVIVQYIQDLYRFYQLNPFKGQIYNPFASDFRLDNKFTLSRMMDTYPITRNIAEYYFMKAQYEQASRFFEQLIQDQKGDSELFEKLGYCYQKIRDFDAALEMYQQADLFDRNKDWLYKNMAFCCRRSGDNQKALEYLHWLHDKHPDDLYLEAQIGHNYFENEKYEQALKHYFKIEYMDPDNSRILRPIAWCSFVMGKMDTAEKYYSKLIDQGDAGYYDLMNLGHLYWCRGEINLAIKQYRQSLHALEDNISQFFDDFRKDQDILINAGVPEIDIILMLDYLRANMDDHAQV